MSKIALNSNASGTGVFTIASPNSDTDRTLTLPDSSGDFVLSASGVISDFTSTGIDDNATSTAITIDSSGHAIIPAGVTLGTAIGTYNADNTLDDYEEGTFTLTLDNIYGGSPNFTNSIGGRYVKIGKIVHCEFQDNINGTNAVAVDHRFRLSGLPFSPATNQASQGTTVIHGAYTSGISSFWNNRIAGQYLYVWCYHEDGAVTYGDELLGSITYETA